jgi:hypothetical protein
LPEDNLVDLAELLKDIYGRRYAPHHRLTNIVQKNAYSAVDFLTGPEEAACFDAREYYRLSRSTLKKAEVIAHLAEDAYEGRLQTDTKWRDIYGMYPSALFELATGMLYGLVVLVVCPVGAAAVTFLTAARHGL